MISKFGSLSQHPFIFSQFLWVRNSGLAGCFWLLVSHGISQDVGRGCSHLKSWRGWRVCFRDGSVSWLLAEGLSSPTPGPFHRELECPCRMAVSFSQSKWSERESKPEATQPYLTQCSTLHLVTDTPWREECERTCGHLKIATVPKGLLCAWHDWWFKGSKAWVTVALQKFTAAWASKMCPEIGHRNQDIPWKTSQKDNKGELFRAGCWPWLLSLSYDDQEPRW